MPIIGELTDLTDGNIKALLPETCDLSLPGVVEGDELVVVTMLERAEG